MSPTAFIRIFLVLGMVSGVASAQAIDSITLTDGATSWTIGNISGHRLLADPGEGTFVTGGVASPMQHWLWYRSEADHREFALSNLHDWTLGTNTATLNYYEPSGSSDAELWFSLQYELHETALGQASGTLTYGVFALTQNAHHVDLFSYLDAALAGTIDDDSAIVSGPQNEIQTVTDGGTASSLIMTASTRALVGYEISGFSSLRDSLTDGSVTNLSNSGSPFGPGDYVGADQWTGDVHFGRVGYVGQVKFDVMAVPEPPTLLAGFLATILVLGARRNNSRV